MPITQVSTLTVVCDNPDCPGNTLDPTVLDGWLLVSHEVYGEPSSESVFCSHECLSVVSGGVAAGKGWDGSDAT